MTYKDKKTQNRPSCYGKWVAVCHRKWQYATDFLCRILSLISYSMLVDFAFFCLCTSCCSLFLVIGKLHIMWLKTLPCGNLLE